MTGDDEETPVIRKRPAAMPKADRPRLADDIEAELWPLEHASARCYSATEDVSAALRDLAFEVSDPFQDAVPELLEHDEDSLVHRLAELERAAKTDPDPVPVAPTTEYSFHRKKKRKP